MMARQLFSDSRKESAKSATLLKRLVFAASVVLAGAGSAHAGCRADTVYLRGDWGQARFSVEVMDTVASRAQGLMNRPNLAKSAGMIFVYEHPQKVSFWMENTLIPLDMIFVDSRGTVKRVHHDAIPLDRTPIDGGTDILAVLEINGGFAEMMGINAGSEMQYPAFPAETAVWPCDK